MAVNIAEQRQTPDTSDGGTHHVWGSLTQNIKLNLIQPLISLLMYGKCWGQSNDWWHLGAATSKTQPTCKAPGFFNAKMAEGKKIKGACTDERNGKYISNNHTVWACLGSIPGKVSGDTQRPQEIFHPQFYCPIKKVRQTQNKGKSSVFTFKEMLKQL